MQINYMLNDLYFCILIIRWLQHKDTSKSLTYRLGGAISLPFSRQHHPTSVQRFGFPLYILANLFCQNNGERRRFRRTG